MRIHYTAGGRRSACGRTNTKVTNRVNEVDCGSCLRTKAFKTSAARRPKKPRKVENLRMHLHVSAADKTAACGMEVYRAGRTLKNTANAWDVTCKRCMASKEYLALIPAKADTKPAPKPAPKTEAHYARGGRTDAMVRLLAGRDRTVGERFADWFLWFTP